MKIINNVNFNKKQLKNAVIELIASAPSSPTQGQFFVNSATNELNVFNGTVWKTYATKDDVTLAQQGLDPKESVKYATVGAIDLSTVSAFVVVPNVGNATGEFVEEGSRILVKNQTPASQNGIYIAKTTGWVRATDANEVGGTLTKGAHTFVEGGTDAGNGYVYVGAGSWTIFSESSTAGTGISISGKQVSIDTNIVARKVSENIGGATRVDFAHNLGTLDVVVSLRENVTAPAIGEIVLAGVEVKDVNTVTIVFDTAPATNAYRVTVVG